MLRRFTVKNYKSIRDTVTLDMCASQIMDSSAGPIQCADGEQLLPLAVIIGMPGSGKTTLFDALQTLRKIVLDPVLPGQETCDLIPVQPFLFSLFKKKERD